MTLVKMLFYELSSDVNSEQGMIDLLRDVRMSIADLDFAFEDKTLKEVLEIIEQGRYDVLHGHKTKARIDLTHAREAVVWYRERSEQPGCRFCDLRGYLGKFPDDKFFYCQKHENLEEMSKYFDEHDSWEFSPRLEKYYKTGCPDKKPVFRKLEVVLDELEKERQSTQQPIEKTQ